MIIHNSDYLKRWTYLWRTLLEVRPSKNSSCQHKESPCRTMALNCSSQGHGLFKQSGHFPESEHEIWQSLLSILSDELSAPTLLSVSFEPLMLLQLFPLLPHMFPCLNCTCLPPFDTGKWFSLPQAKPCQHAAHFPKPQLPVASVPLSIALQNSFQCLRSPLGHASHNLHYICKSNIKKAVLPKELSFNKIKSSLASSFKYIIGLLILLYTASWFPMTKLEEIVNLKKEKLHASNQLTSHHK